MQQRTEKELVTRAEYARMRGLNRSTISRQCRDGVIRLHGGLVDPAEADEGRNQNLSFAHQAAAARRKRMAGDPEETEKSQQQPETHQLLDEIRRNVFRCLPELVLKVADRLRSVPAKQRRIVAAMLSPEIVEGFLLGIEDDVPGYRWPRCRGADYGALAREAGIPGTPAAWEEAADPIDDFISDWFSRAGLWGPVCQRHAEREARRK